MQRLKGKRKNPRCFSTLCMAYLGAMLSLLHTRLASPPAGHCSLALARRRSAHGRRPLLLALANQHDRDSPGRREQHAGGAQGGFPAGGSGSGPQGGSPAAGGFKGFQPGQGHRAPGGSGRLPKQAPSSAGAPPLPPGENPGWAQQEQLRAMERKEAAERQGAQEQARARAAAAAALASLEGPALLPLDAALSPVEHHVRILLGRQGILAASPRNEALRALTAAVNLLEQDANNAIVIAYWHLSLVGGSPSGCSSAIAWQRLLPKPQRALHGVPFGGPATCCLAVHTSSNHPWPGISGWRQAPCWWLGPASLLLIPWPAAAGPGIPGPCLPAARPQQRPAGLHARSSLCP